MFVSKMKYRLCGHFDISPIRWLHVINEKKKKKKEEKKERMKKEEKEEKKVSFEVITFDEKFQRQLYG